MALKERLVFPDQSGSYPLLRAIKNNHYNGILKCIFNHELLQKELINYCDAFNKTPLQQCWSQWKPKCALLILNIAPSEKQKIKMIATPTANIRGVWPWEKDMTSLQCALFLADLECVQFIFDQLKRDNKIMHQLLDAGSPHYCARDNFHYACGGGNVDCLKLLISESDEKARAELWVPHTCAGFPLLDSVAAGSPECTEFLLRQMNDEQINEFFKWHGLRIPTPIVYLTQRYKSEGHSETLKVMISYVTNDSKAELGCAFLYAARNDNIELGKFILTKASDRNQMLNIVNCTEGTTCALHACAENNSLNFLKYLFEIISADNSQFVMKQNNEKQNEWYGYTGLMIAATKCNIKCCQLILDHLKYDGKLLNQVLKMKNNNHATALELASISTYKNNTKCVQTIIEYYANDDIESVFTPCVQLGDLQMVQSIWNKAGNDTAIQNKLLSAIDKDNNNCFLLAAKNGNEACLEWLLTLNQEEAERLVMQKHTENGMTALILAVSNDDR
eukprot:1046824_1